MDQKRSAVIGIFTFILITIPFRVAHTDDAVNIPTDRTPATNEVEVSRASTAASNLKKYFSDKFHLTLNNIYWGELHTHTKYSLDAAKCGALSPDKAYAYARDKARLDFVALSDHAEMQNKKAVPEQDESTCKSTLRIGQLYNNEDASEGKVFIVFPGWEYTNTHGLQDSGCGSAQGYGHKTVIFKNLKDGLPDDEYGAFNMAPAYLAEDATALWNALQSYRSTQTAQATAFTIVHTPAHVGKGDGDPQDHRTDWNVMNRDFVRHVEIYSKWGGSEGPPPAGLACPEEEPPFEYTSTPEGDPLSVRSILYTRWVKEGSSRFQLGFVGGTDNHVGKPGNPGIDQCGWEYRGGITGIVASSLTRDQLWTRLWKRHTLAASAGVRMPVLFAAETGGKHLLMGDLGSHNGTVKVRALAGTNVTKLEVIVDGCVDPKSTATGYTLESTLTLTPGWHYLYVRATLQKDADNILRAWTSPVYLKPPAQ
jgi:hypothetical protein